MLPVRNESIPFSPLEALSASRRAGKMNHSCKRYAREYEQQQQVHDICQYLS